MMRKELLDEFTYYVTGNHVARIDEYEELIAGLENAGVQVLENEYVLLEQSV